MIIGYFFTIKIQDYQNTLEIYELTLKNYRIEFFIFFFNCSPRYFLRIFLQKQYRNSIYCDEKINKKSKESTVQASRAKKLVPKLSQAVLSLQRFSNELCELQLKTKTKKQDKKHTFTRKRLKKFQTCIQQIKSYLTRDNSVQPPTSYVPIYYYPPLANIIPKNQLCLPQLNTGKSSTANLNSTQIQTISQDNSNSRFPTARPTILEFEKIKKHNLKSRFRIYVIAVYFCLIFPKFSTNFQHIRYEWFKDRYKTSSLNRRLEEMNLCRMYDQSKTKCYQTSKFPIISFIKLFLKELGSILTNKLTLKYHHELLGVGAINKHFYLNYKDSYMYYPEEIPLLHLMKSTNGYEQLFFNREAEILLIMIRTMFKVVLFNYLWGICSAQIDQCGQDKQKFYMIKICAIFLHSLCVDIYKIGLKNLEISIPKQSDKENNEAIRKLNQQYTTTTINLLTTNSIFYFNAHIPEPSKQLQTNNEPFSFIQNMPNYKKYLGQINRSSILHEFRPEATRLILNIVIEIRQYLYEEERSLYRFIWGLTAEKKYLLQNQNFANKTQEIILKTDPKGIHRRYRSQDNENIQENTFRTNKSILKKSLSRNISRICQIPYDIEKQKIAQKSSRNQASTPSILRSKLTVKSEYERTQGLFNLIR